MELYPRLKHDDEDVHDDDEGHDDDDLLEKDQKPSPQNYADDLLGASFAGTCQRSKAPSAQLHNHHHCQHCHHDDVLEKARGLLVFACLLCPFY